MEEKGGRFDRNSNANRSLKTRDKLSDLHPVRLQGDRFKASIIFKLALGTRVN